MCTAIFAARLFSVFLIASIMGGLLPDNPKYQKNNGKLWTPEENFHLLSLVERMDEKLASQETQMTTVLESLTNLTSLYGTLEQRLNNTEHRLERKLDQDIESLKDKLEQENRILKDKLEQDIEGLKDKLEQENRILKDKLEQENRILKEELEQDIDGLKDKLERENRILKDKLEQDIEGLKDKLEQENRVLNNSLTLGFDGVSYKIDYYNGPRTFENCKKGMQKYTPHYPYPYPIVYSNIGTADQKEFLCDTSTAEGGWIIIQHRSKGDIDFYRGWEDYKKGFGSLKTDFWIGLDTIHKLTSSATYELRIELKYKGESKFAHYRKFSVEGEAENYTLSVGAYDGTAGDSLTSWHNGMQFSTKDRDNDKDSFRNCAVLYLGAWWYKHCHLSNLNGKWGEGGSKGPMWRQFTGPDPATFTEMKIRRV